LFLPCLSDRAVEEGDPKCTTFANTTILREESRLMWMPEQMKLEPNTLGELVVTKCIYHPSE
jgi:hypothetical protein